MRCTTAVDSVLEFGVGLAGPGHKQPIGRANDRIDQEPVSVGKRTQRMNKRLTRPSAFKAVRKRL
jgi:hypothetical protein